MTGSESASADAVLHVGFDATPVVPDEDRFWRLVDFTLGTRSNVVGLAIGLVVPIVLAPFVAPQFQAIAYTFFVFGLVFLAGLVFATIPNYELRRAVLGHPRFAAEFMMLNGDVTPADFRTRLFGFLEQVTGEHKAAWRSVYQLERMNQFFWRHPWVWVLLVADVICALVIVKALLR